MLDLRSKSPTISGDTCHGSSCGWPGCRVPGDLPGTGQGTAPQRGSIVLVSTVDLKAIKMMPPVPRQSSQQDSAERSHGVLLAA